MLLLGVSGGIDSMVLAEKVRLSGEPFAVAHCNFGLRGDESDADEAFVRDWCAGYGIHCHVRRFATTVMAKEQGISIEMCARKVRYHWFGQLCRQFGYDAVAVAHNANDNAETLLLNLLRGTGVKGILGMRASGFLPDPAFNDIPLLRPLLGMTRDDIVSFAGEHGISFREDSSNSHSEFKRNKMEKIALLLQAVLTAENKVGLMMNCHVDNLEKVLAILPAMNRPTIAHLSDQNWYSLTTVVDEHVVRDIIPELKKAGAEGIVEYNLNKVIP